MRMLMLLALVSLLGAQTATIDSKGAPAAPTGNAEKGKKLFASYGCYQCHGYVGQGGVGPRIAPRPLALPAFSRYVRQPTGEMPPYTMKVVSDQELSDIYAFIQSIAPPPPVKNIPLLN